MWGISLSAPLGIVGLVGRYPANYLMPRMPILYHRSSKCKTMRFRILTGY